MYKDMIYLGSINNARTYQIVDSSFKEEVSLNMDSYKDAGSIAFEILLIQTYERRGLTVPKNLAAFYWQYFRRTPNFEPLVKMETWRRDFERLLPEMQYTKKYYNCVVNQLKQISRGTIK